MRRRNAAAKAFWGATSASRPGKSQSWTYDANGNRLTEGGANPSTYSVSTTSNRLAGVSGALSRTYTYADSGQVTGYGGFTFSYNDAGRLTGLSGSATASYVLNALGQRVKKTVDSTSTYFVYDEAGHLIGEYGNTGETIQEVVWMGDTPVASLRDCSCGEAIFYIHTDHLNTPRKITKRSTTDLVWRWDSDPFGTGAANEDPDGDGQAFGFNLRLPGQYFDAESGSAYNYFRDYDPYTGRYLQSDPIGLSGGINTYAYAKGRPTLAIDPKGLFAITPVTSWTYESKVPAQNANAGGTTRTGIAVTCTCTPQCNVWKLAGCSAEYRIRVTIHSGATGEMLKSLKGAEAQHVADYLGAVPKMLEAGEQAEKDLADRTFPSRFECESRIARYVLGILRDIDADTEKETRRRYDYYNGPHTFR